MCSVGSNARHCSIARANKPFYNAYTYKRKRVNSWASNEFSDGFFKH